MSEQKLIECPDCESKVTAKLLAKRVYPPTDNYDPFEEYFLECPWCHRTMVGHADIVQIGEEEWGPEDPTRLWPEPGGPLNWEIPHFVRKSIEEARSCFKGKAYSATAVMSGRALEGLCKEQSTTDWRLGNGLRELKDRGVIDGRLFEWGKALQERRNTGAHVTDDEVSREDAEDLLGFTVAICDYVYVLSARFDRFKKRQTEKTTGKGKVN